MSEHLSESLLERKAMGLLTGDRARAAEAHLASCETCCSRLVVLEQQQTEFNRAHDPAVFARRVLARVERDQEAKQPHSRFSWAWLGGLLVPAAAMAVLLLVRTPKPDDYLGVKGGVRLVLASPQGRLGDGAQVHPGEALQFVVSAPADGYGLVLGLNDKGELFPYFPLQGKGSEPVHAGQNVPLPGSVILDEQLGKERFYLLVTPHPVTVAQVEAAVHAAHTTLNLAQLPIQGEQASVLVEKVR